LARVGDCEDEDEDDSLWPPLQKIIEIVFGADITAQAEDMGREAVGVEFDVVCIAVPEEAGVGEQIVHLEREQNNTRIDCLAQFAMLSA